LEAGTKYGTIINNYIIMEFSPYGSVVMKAVQVFMNQLYLGLLAGLGSITCECN